MKRITTVLLFGSLALSFSCTSKALDGLKAPPKAKKTPRVFQKGGYSTHGSNLIIQDESNGSTSVYLQDVKVREELARQAGQPPEQHIFEFTTTGSYTGATPMCTDGQLSMRISHGITDQGYWHFVPNVSITFVVDDKRTQLKTVNQSELSKDSRGEYWEGVGVVPTCDLFAKIADAKKVSIEVGARTLTLADDNVGALGDFAAAIGAAKE